ncbi:MAG TPA: hypothetical protein VGI68_20230 [Mycobacterium sp.]
MASNQRTSLAAPLRGTRPNRDGPLMDDSLFMAARWNTAGNVGELAVYPGGVHGFNALTAFPTPVAKTANDRIAAFINTTLAQQD